MIKKICVGFLSIKLALFAIGGLADVVGHGRLGVSMASAQSRSDGLHTSDDDKGSSNSYAKAAPPDIAGDWSGTVEDSIFGDGTFNVTIYETAKGKLSGSWSDSFGFEGEFKGKINSKGATHFDFHNGRCHAIGVGMLVSADELTSIFRLKNCGEAEKGEHGMLDLFND